MIKTNYHMHSNFSDGKADLEDYVKAAIEKGFVSIGFSEHGPTKFKKHWELTQDRVKEYFSETKRLKEFYSDRIEIYCGLELDFLPGVESNDFYEYDLDYRIGSIHYFFDEEDIYGVDCKFDDFKKTVFDYFKGDIKKMVGEFYSRIIQMVEKFEPEIIGHFDLIKINNTQNKFFHEGESWYKDEVMKVLEFISDKGTMLDVNTGGITRGFLTEPYPSAWALKEAAHLKIPVTLNSDAHRPEHIDGNFELVTQILKDAGYKEKMILSGGKWESAGL
ncbi:MAG: histidinol-phosphatase HisJ [Candidatus Delongbacteria bacterium]|nr:histidinol-phosphatase HisJ [Candidatus Delongbacteria bacterium]